MANAADVGDDAIVKAAAAAVEVAATDADAHRLVVR